MTRTRILLPIIVLGSILRLLAAWFQPIALDEAYAIHEAKFYRFPFTPSSPPLFPLFFRLWTGVSIQLFWIRLPQILAGIVTLLVIWQIASRVHRRQAVIACLLAATSALMVHYSWFARIYGLEILCISLSLLLSLRAADAVARNAFPDRKLLLYLTAVHIAGSLLNYGFSVYLVSLILAGGTWLMAVNKRSVLMKHRGTLFLFLGIHAAVIGALAAYVASHAAEIRSESMWIPAFSVSGFTGLLATLVNMSGVITGAPLPMIQAVLAVFSLAGIAALSYVAVPPSLRFFRYLLPVSLLTAFAAAFLTSTGIPRTFLFLHVIAVIDLACCINFLLRRKPGLAVALVAIYCIGNISSYAAYNIRPYYNNPRTLRLIRAYQNKPGRTVLVPFTKLPVVEYAWGFRRPDIAKLSPIESEPSLPFTLMHFATSPLSQDEGRRIQNAHCSVENGDNIVIYYCQ